MLFGHFYKHKASHRRDNSIWYSLSLFYFLSIISAFAISCLSWKHSLRLEFVISLRLLSEPTCGKTCCFRTVLTPLLLTMVSMSHMYCRLFHRGCSVWIQIVKIPIQKFKSQLNLTASAMFSDKARCFGQLKRTLYGNFIIVMSTNHSLVKFQLMIKMLPKGQLCFLFICRQIHNKINFPKQQPHASVWSFTDWKLEYRQTYNTDRLILN